MLDIRAGLSNHEIGRKYGLSEKGIQSVFDKLFSANLLTEEERRRLLVTQIRDSGSESDNGGPAEPTITHAEAPLAKPQPLNTSGSNHEALHTELSGEKFGEPVYQDGPLEQKIQADPVSTHTDFIDVSNYGKNQWWRYLLSILFILIFSVSAWGIGVAVWAPQATWDETTSNFVGIDSLYNYILQNLIFVFFLFTLFLAVRYEHKRSFLSLITPNQSVDWVKLTKSFGLFFLLILISLAVGYVLDPGGYQFNSDLSRFFAFLPVVLVLTPIQTTVEELFFRGFLLQMTGLIIRNRYLIIVVSAVIFMLVHLGNPEVALGPIAMALNYFVVGAFLTFITWKNNGLEVAIGIHAATNLSAGLIVNYTNSALKTESLFLCTSMDPVESLVSFCVTAAIFYLFMFGGRITLRKPWIVWSRTA